MPDDKPVDVVNREEYNKIVEAHNSNKVENERKLKEIEMKNEEERKKWKEEAENQNKQIEDLKKIAEEKKPAPKGIVTEPARQPDVKKMLDEKIPDRPKNPEKFGSKIQRFGYYKSGTTKQYTDEQLGMGLSLHAGAISTNPDLIPNAAKKSKDDIII